jgi:hypothetical protein
MPPSDPLLAALDHLLAALTSTGRPGTLAPFLAARGGALEGEFEVRSADGHVRRMQRVRLALPAPLVRAFAHLAPRTNLRIDLATHTLTLWAPQELIELQVGLRWHGFTGKRMGEWDERYVVFAEDGGDPLALRLDEQDGPTWLSHRGEGRYAFFAAADSLAQFYEALALRLECPDEAALERRLRERFGAAAKELWIWKQCVSRVEARR